VSALRRPAITLPAGIEPLHAAIAASLALHGLLLLLNFSGPDFQRQLKDKALEIVLVNSRSSTRPKDAQVMAQTNLDGGGNVDENRRAKTPLPPSASEKTGDKLDAAQQRVRELERRQRELMIQARKPAPATTRERPREDAPEAPLTPNGRDLASNALAMARMQAEIDRNVDAYNKRPRRQFVGSRAAEYRFAQYVEDWRLKVERIGTLNYPDQARGKVYGNLVLTVILLADGTVERVDINRSSGHAVLDNAARRIVQMGGPYAPFPPDIRRDTDILEITRTWFFTREDTVKSQ
jgi:protein TonB